MTDRLADKAALAVDSWLEERGLGIYPREPTRGKMDEAPVRQGLSVRSFMAAGVWIAMAANAPAPDTKGLAQAVLDVVLKGHDDG